MQFFTTKAQRLKVSAERFNYLHKILVTLCLCGELLNKHKTLDPLREETGKTLFGLIRWIEAQINKGKKTKSDLA